MSKSPGFHPPGEKLYKTPCLAVICDLHILLTTIAPANTARMRVNSIIQNSDRARLEGHRCNQPETGAVKRHGKPRPLHRGGGTLSPNVAIEHMFHGIHYYGQVPPPALVHFLPFPASFHRSTDMLSIHQPRAEFPSGSPPTMPKASRPWREISLRKQPHANTMGDLTVGPYPWP